MRMSTVHLSLRTVSHFTTSEIEIQKYLAAKFLKIDIKSSLQKLMRHLHESLITDRLKFSRKCCREKKIADM